MDGIPFGELYLDCVRDVSRLRLYQFVSDIKFLNHLIQLSHLLFMNFSQDILLDHCCLVLLG